jgi:vanillate O-demethylase ferredoxin subunit
MNQTLDLRVRAITWEADGILGFELVPTAPNALLPAFDAGAHVDLHLGNGLIRSYSLLNAPGERQRWCIAVNRDAASRGGSRFMHESVRPGQIVPVGAPRNNFPLREDAAFSVFIAGGIGITPILAMIRRLTALGRPWALHCAARTRATAAFVPTLTALAEQAGATLDIRYDQEPGARRLDLAAITAALPDDAHVYCCGPLPMLAAFEAATAALPRERVHVEYFATKDAPATAGGFEVKLVRSGRSVAVAAGQSILDALIAVGVEPPNSCREGICGTCETRVLCGTPDHRDLVLSEAEKAAGDRMMICCSGAKSPTLELDL